MTADIKIVRHDIFKFKFGVGYIQARADGTWSAVPEFGGLLAVVHGLTERGARDAVLAEAEAELVRNPIYRPHLSRRAR